MLRCKIRLMLCDNDNALADVLAILTDLDKKHPFYPKGLLLQGDALFQMVLDPGFLELSRILDFQAIESLGLFPKQLFWMLFPLLEKPTSGLRPILLCAGPVRVWERLRRSALLDFKGATSNKSWA